MQKLVVLSGAGISAESGIPTFRDADGLWEGYDVMEVASPIGWHKNPQLVLDFYNMRRKRALEVFPNAGHEALAALEAHFEVTIITQNVDNLHERAGSSRVVHLHGSLFEARSTLDESLVYPITSWELSWGQTCERGSQLRPHIVWFGEAVPMMEKASEIAAQADIFLVVGTSLVVYPAAGLVDYVPSNAPMYVIDPHLPPLRHRPNLMMIKEKSSVALPSLAKELIQKFA
jgi:NAD-dependent deacetylase